MPPATAVATFPTSIDIPEKNRERIIGLLNARLADATDLKTQTKHAHWNVKGENFYQLHLLFDEVAGHLEEHTDLLAERATALGGTALGTARNAAAASTLPEYPQEAVDGPEHVRALAARLAQLAATVRDAINKSAEWGDPSTADVFTEISRSLDKDLWFLEAHLQGRR
ncbi:MAG TPA: DNA starvation/stationary phase protection protein Dps [Terriglobales bacterium]|jgi:starvation-inducible DNA-binding protein|nr:DNA starvation/stationary phase protection protein Dps [Terriglobales bacterium]